MYNINEFNETDNNNLTYEEACELLPGFKDELRDYYSSQFDYE